MGRAYEASYTKDQYRQVHESVKRGGCAVHPVAQSPEALEPAEGALDDVALPLERGVLGIQLADACSAGMQDRVGMSGRNPCSCTKLRKRRLS